MTVPLEEGHCWSCLHFPSFLLSRCLRKVIDLYKRLYRLSIRSLWCFSQCWPGLLEMYAIYSVQLSMRSIRCLSAFFSMLCLAKATRIQMQNRQLFFSPNLTACTKEKSSATSDSTFSRICAWPKWQGLHGTKRFNVIITNSKIPRYANYSILADVQGFKKLFWPGALSHRFQNFVSATALRLVWLPNSAASHPGQIRLNKDLGEFKDFGGTHVIVMSPFSSFFTSSLALNQFC